MHNSYQKTILSNGLTVMMKEIHTAPIISNWIWYRVGSRDETPGITGISHWVEHMQFKGTPQFPAGVLDKAISRQGGLWNAFTYLDWTTFYETMPAAEIDLGLRLEADRMMNSVYDPQEVASERTVIISERQGNENEPLFRLGEAVQAASFLVHPYHHEVIGDMVDLETIQRDDLYHHYRTFYVPANAVLALAGDFDSHKMLDRVRELYEPVPGGKAPLHPAQPEPPPSGEQRVNVHGPGETTYVQVTYRAPAAANPDFFAYTILDSLLTGPTGLNMFGGGGTSNKTSRLYRALVEKELAVSVSGGMQATIDPFLYDITLTVRPGVDPEDVLRALDSQIQRLQEELIPAEEVERAIKQARALFAYGSENITNQAFWLGYALMFADYDWFVQYVERLAEINPEDVAAMAHKYLQPTHRVVGIYRPDAGEAS